MGFASSTAERIRVGVVGHGAAGRRRRFAAEAHPRIEVVALCDPAFASPREPLETLRCHAHLDAFFEERLDAIFVCTTPVSAPLIALTALDRDLHVLCEKPPAATLAALAPVLAAEAAHPALKLMYGFNHRLHRSVLEARDIVESRQLGRVIAVRGVYGRSYVADSPDAWRARPEDAGGGILLDQGIHLVDLARLFAGDFVEVHAFVDRSTHGLALEDNAWALMRTADGTVAMLQSSATEWRHRFLLEITLTEGALELHGLLSSTGAYAPEQLIVRRRGAPGASTETRRSFDIDTSWSDEVDLFATSILDDTPVVHGSSRDAYAALELVERIYRGGDTAGSAARYCLK